MAMTIVENHLLSVTGGIDTHRDFHVAAAVDPNGGLLGVETFDTTTGGYRRLVAWLAGFGDIDLIGVEGTGSYGAGIARHLGGKGIRVVEVDRPNRQARHRAGKTDAATRSQQPEPHCPAQRPVFPRRGPGRSKQSGC